MGSGILLTEIFSVDNLKNTAGDIALSLNDEDTYMVIRDAGLRAGAFLSGCLLLKTTNGYESSCFLYFRAGHPARALLT